MRRPRALRGAILGWCLLILSTLGLFISIPVMALRLSDRPDLQRRPLVWFESAAVGDSFEFQGERVAVETQERNAAGQALERPQIVIRWRGQELRWDVGGRDDQRLPGLLRHEEWFRIMPMVQANAASDDEVKRLIGQGEIQPRLIAVGRYPAEGFNAGSWGLVRRREWRYRFAEFLTEGDAAQSIRTSESTYGELEGVIAPGPYDKPRTDLTDDDRERIRWQHAAMIQVTPAPLYRARDKQVDKALAIMGWTWPTAGASVLGIIVGALLIATARPAQPYAGPTT